LNSLDTEQEERHMSWKEVVVYVKRDPDSAGFLQTAAQLARQFQARVTGIFALSDLATVRSALERISDENAVRQYVREAYETAELYESRFRRQMSDAQVECDWRTGEGDPAQVMTLAARVADLVVVEQQNPQAYDSAWDVPEEVALNGGVPTLVVPYSQPAMSIGRRVLIAWNGSREAACAVGSAMPLIDKSDAVVVLAGGSKEQFATVTRRPQIGLQHRLRAHCAKIDVVEFRPSWGEEGEQILANAKSHGCDLVVMGAYGHSRVREALLGGATRHVLRNMQVPVLFGH
jgi:nucleotide-binding universal stress UspA family protein